MRKKLLATIFAVVMCATSAVSMGAGALVMMDEDVTLYTTAFSCGGTRYSLWQKATDYFDNENLKIYADDLTKDIPSSMAYYPGSVSVFVIDGYNLHSEEEVDFFESYLEDNDIEYSVRDLKPNSSDVLVRIDIKRPEGKTKDDMYDIWIKIKEDTGFMLDWFMLDSTGYVTDVENTLPQATHEISSLSPFQGDPNIPP